MEVLVLDANGKPVEGALVTFHSPTFGGGANSAGSSRTDESGLARMYISSLAQWSASTVSEDGTENNVYYERPTEELREHPEYQIIRWYWYNPAWGGACNMEIYQPSEVKKHLEIHLRIRDAAISPWVLDMLHKDLVDIRAGRHQARWVLGGGEIETLEVLPELLEMVKKHQIQDRDALGLLDELSYLFGSMFLAVDEGAKPKAISREKDHLKHLSQWVKNGSEPVDLSQTALEVKRRLLALLDEFVDTSELFWANNGPVGMDHIGKISKQFVPRLLAQMEKLPDNDPNQNKFSFVVSGAWPDVEQVRPFFDSPSRQTAVAALASVKEKLPRQELARRLQSLSHPGEKNGIQYSIDGMLDDIKRAANN